MQRNCTALALLSALALPRASYLSRPVAARSNRHYLGNDYDDAGDYEPADLALLEAPNYLGSDLELLGDDDLMLLGDDDMVLGDDIELLGDDAENLAALLGQDALELLGADPRRKRAMALRKRAMALRNRRVAKRPQPQLGRELFLPIPSTGVIAAGGATIVNVQPQVTCQINQLVIPSTMGPFWLVLDVTVATRSQFAAPGAISAVALSEVQTGKLKGDTATLGTIISVSLQNISGANQTMQGAFFRAYGVVS